MVAHGKTILALVGGAALLASCGGGGGGSSSNGGTQGGTPGFYIVIQSMTYTPADLSVPPGATVTVLNREGAVLHSVTSEAASGDLTPGAVNGVQFDTGPFTGTRSFTIPSTATDGMVIPFYCTVHRLDMIPPNGSIRVDSNAQPAPAPGGTNTGGTGGGGGGGGGMY